MGTAVTLELKYFFGVHFKDGSEYFQNATDSSMAVRRRSAYYDICEHDDDGKLLVDTQEAAIARADIELFMLDGMGVRLLVDLRDGHFESGPTPEDGEPFKAVPFFIASPPKEAVLRLVYFRRRRIHFTAGDVSGTECEYHIGWKYDLEGKTVEHTLFLV